MRFFRIHSRFADGLPFKLCYPIFKMLKEMDPQYTLGKNVFKSAYLYYSIRTAIALKVNNYSTVNNISNHNK